MIRMFRCAHEFAENSSKYFDGIFHVNPFCHGMRELHKSAVTLTQYNNAR